MNKRRCVVMHDAPSFQLLSDHIFLFMIHPLFCFCAFLHKSIRLTFAIANFLQFAATLQFRLQTSYNLQQPYNSDCKPSASLQQLYNSDCKLPASCSNLAIPIADFLQFAATLQFRLQTSFIYKRGCVVVDI